MIKPKILTTTALARRAEKKWGISFKKKSLLLAALIHPSYRHEAPAPKLDDFERLELFGDAILNFAVTRKLYTAFPDANEGLLSQHRSALVSKKILARVASRMALADFILLGRSQAHTTRHEKAKILADTLEAIIAAIFFDRGLKAAETFILKHLSPYVDVRYLARTGVSPKNILQEWLQKRHHVLPQYHSEMKDGRFIAWAEAPAKGKAKGEGRSKKDAEEKAARALLRMLKKRAKP